MNTDLPRVPDDPIWFSDAKVNEMLFCEQFIKNHPLKYINRSFYSVDGRIDDEEQIKNLIYDEIKYYQSYGVAKKVNALLDSLRLECYSPPISPCFDRIHTLNGTLFLSGKFTKEKEFCINRLPVAYHPDAPPPERWLDFLNQLLYPEDIPTLQEYMGYCLIPSTKGQKMLFLVGKGGEGKSRIGVVMNKLFSSNMNTGSIAKVEVNKFARADLENKLVLLDDDMKLEALPSTNHIKSIVTAELPMDLEVKSKQSFQGLIYARFLAFGNGTLQSLYDRSDGFYRRQLILTVREREKGRKDDPYLAEKLCEEIEGIFLWCLEGLQRLLANQYQFTISDRAKENLAETICDSNNIVEFLASTGYIEFHADDEISSRALYAIYERWCMDNSYSPLSSRTFLAYLKQHEKEYNLEYCNTIRSPDGHRVRGFMGIRAAY